MGREAGFALEPGQAAAIPTGGMLPVGADAVVMLEYAEQPDGRTLLVQKKAAPNENVLTHERTWLAARCLWKKACALTRGISAFWQRAAARRCWCANASKWV